MYIESLKIRSFLAVRSLYEKGNGLFKDITKIVRE